MRVNMNIPDELLNRIDDYANRNFMNRTSVVCFSCNQFLNADEIQGLLKDMSLAMRKIADKGEVDDKTLEQLEDFERVFKMLFKNFS